MLSPGLVLLRLCLFTFGPRAWKAQKNFSRPEKLFLLRGTFCHLQALFKPKVAFGAFPCELLLCRAGASCSEDPRAFCRKKLFGPRKFFPFGPGSIPSAPTSMLSLRSKALHLSVQAVALSCWRLLLAEDPRRKQLFGSRKFQLLPLHVCAAKPLHLSMQAVALSCWRLARGGSSQITTFRVPTGKLFLCPAGASCSQRFRALAAGKNFSCPESLFSAFGPPLSCWACAAAFPSASCCFVMLAPLAHGGSGTSNLS